MSSTESIVTWTTEQPEAPKKKGVLFIAFGYEYLFMAIHSARTAKQETPGIGAAIVTNIPVSDVLAETGKPLFDYISFSNDALDKNRKYKLSLDKISPFEETIFLDADTEIRRDLSPMFEILRHHPIAARPRVNATKWCFPLWGRESTDFGLCEYNSGVIGFVRSHPLVNHFFESWASNYSFMGDFHDQGSFMRSVYNEDYIPILPLSGEWNATDRNGADRKLLSASPERVFVFHYREAFKSKRVVANIAETSGMIDVRFISGHEVLKHKKSLANAIANLSAGRAYIKRNVTASRGKIDKYIIRDQKSYPRFRRLMSYLGFSR